MESIAAYPVLSMKWSKVFDTETILLLPNEPEKWESLRLCPFAGSHVLQWEASSGGSCFGEITQDRAGDILKNHLVRMSLAHGLSADTAQPLGREMDDALKIYRRRINLGLGALSQEQIKFLFSATSGTRSFPLSPIAWSTGKTELRFHGAQTFLNGENVTGRSSAIIPPLFGREISPNFAYQKTPGGCFASSAFMESGRIFEILKPENIPIAIEPDVHVLKDAIITRDEIMYTPGMRVGVDWTQGTIGRRELDKSEQEKWSLALHQVTGDSYWVSPRTMLEDLAFPADTNFTTADSILSCRHGKPPV